MNLRLRRGPSRPAIPITVFIAILLAGAPAWAQATAQMSGRVTDESGAVLPGVTVTVTQTVSVDAAAPLVDVQSAGIGEVVERRSSGFLLPVIKADGKVWRPPLDIGRRGERDAAERGQ
jgi:hypothetical protein